MNEPEINNTKSADWLNIFQNAVANKHDSIFAEIENAEERYKEIRFIDKGGSKEIFEVLDVHTGRHVALAYPLEDATEEQIEKFFIESRVHSILEHPNIIPIYDSGIRNGRAYFTMKLIGGRNLKDHLKENPDLSLDEKINIFVKVCEAIAYSHSVGIAHFDIKPDNIQISNYGEILVCDWGLAKDIDSLDKSSTEPLRFETVYESMDGFIKGTPGYMSPEQALGENDKKDFRSDIYSLGAIFYELLTGRIPISETDIKKSIIKTVKGDICLPREINKKIPESLESICMKAMAVSKADRYPSVDELLDDINSFKNHYTVSAEDASFLKELHFFYRRNQKLVILTFSSLLLIFILTSYFVLRIQKKTDEALQAQKKAELSEYRIRHESLKNQQLMKTLIPKYDEDLQAAILNHNYQDVLDFISRIIYLDKNHKSAITYKALILIAQEKFREAKKLFETSNPDYISDCNDLIKNKVNLIDYINRGQFWNRNLKNELQHSLLLQAYLNREDVSVNNKIECLKMAIEKDNPGKLIFNYSTENGLAIDMRGSTKLWDIRPLKNLELTSLDISNTLFGEISQLANASIQKLNISNTQIMNIYSINSIKGLKELNMEGLSVIRNASSLKALEIKKLNIAKSGILNLKTINGAVEELDISGYELKNLLPLLNLHNLKKITVSKKIQKVKVIRDLRAKGIEVLVRE